MKFYVVTHPPEVRGVYDTWAACREAVSGVRGARYQAVTSREKAEAMLAGTGIVLRPGTWAFTDGNAAGGVGVVLVEQGPEGPSSVHETSTWVHEVFADGDIPGLESPAAVTEALRRLHNILAEMAGLYHVLRIAPAGTDLTVVHDYKGVSEWLQGKWKARDPIVKAVVEACGELLRERELKVTFQHQRGHQSTWAGNDDFARWNARADALATQGGRGEPAIG